MEKTSKTESGQDIHYSVGAIIKRNEKYLLIDRKITPFGFAAIAGHIEEGETPEHALFREVEEEAGILLESYRLLTEGKVSLEPCSRGVLIHYWYVYECITSGKIKISEKEAKSYGWYSKEEIKKLKLEKAWKFWFKKLGIV